ncbi:GNAT family N-acetyltransferase [Embleya sp. NPDC059237]|uniref:GNAT family N-acetyltransferase n=1 Tax=Embleya sp. NPDC059237 TaxID=3346784 RepID=UPI0036B4C454
MIDIKVTQGSLDDVADFVSMLYEHTTWLLPTRYVDLPETLEWEEPPPIVKQVLRHTRAGRTRICRHPSDGITGGSVPTDEAPEFVPPADEPELYLYLLVSDARHWDLDIAALVADARAEAARRGIRLLRTHCRTGEDGWLVHDYEKLGFTPTLEFEVLRADGSFWPGQVLETRV